MSKVGNSGKGGAILKVMAVLFAIVAVAYLIVSLVLGQWNPIKWKEIRQHQTQGESGGDGKEPEPGGDNKPSGELNVTENNGISLLTELIPEEEFAAYNVSETATKAYHITATVNADAADKSVIGAIGWKNGSSDWATGKSLTDYAVLTQTTEYGLEFNLEILQAFGEPITLKVASCMDSSINATAEVNYLKELISYTATINTSLPEYAAGRIYVGDTANTVSITPFYGVGTVTGTLSNYKVGMHVKAECVTALNNAFKAGYGTSGFYGLQSLAFNGESFTIPLTSLFSGGGNTPAAEVIVNNFIKQNGCGDYTGSSESTIAAVDIVRFTVTYSYGDYSKTMTSGANVSWGFRNDNLTTISTITDISLDKNEIVVYPES